MLNCDIPFCCEASSRHFEDLCEKQQWFSLPWPYCSLCSLEENQHDLLEKFNWAKIYTYFIYKISYYYSHQKRLYRMLVFPTRQKYLLYVQASLQLPWPTPYAIFFTFTPDSYCLINGYYLLSYAFPEVHKKKRQSWQRFGGGWFLFGNLTGMAEQWPLTFKKQRQQHYK